MSPNRPNLLSCITHEQVTSSAILMGFPWWLVPVIFNIRILIGHCDLKLFFISSLPFVPLI